jgi:hypothetical protein
MKPLSPVNAALRYAEQFGPVFPVKYNSDPAAKKYPHTPHGSSDATRHRSIIADWWRRWPNAVPAIITGEPSNIVALDIDERSDGSGFDTLQRMGVVHHPVGPTAHSPRGGCAVLFRWPGHFVKTVSGVLGREFLDDPRTGSFLDIRADRGSIILPPGPGRYWDPCLGPDTLIEAMPSWMEIQEPAIERPDENVRPSGKKQPPASRYALRALDGAVQAIVSAPAGQQRDTVNREIYSIARLVSGGEMPAGLAIESLRWAAGRMRSHDAARPWRPAELDKLVRLAFADGLARPRWPS